MNLLLQQLDLSLANFTKEFQAPIIDTSDKFNLDFSQDLRLKRNAACGGSVGNLGFNSFNFLTFMVMVFNAVANVNNNINNNNNNNQDFNLNSISQDSNSVVANSDNQNSVMAIILPVPGKRKKRQEFCKISIFNIFKDLLGKISRAPFCSEYFICQALLSIQKDFQLESIIHQGQELEKCDFQHECYFWQ